MKLPQNKKILVVAESIDVDNSSGAKGRVSLIKNLHKTGYDLRVLHYSKKEIQLPEICCIAIREKRWTGLFFLNRIERYLRNLLKIDIHKPLEKVFGFSFTLFNDRNSIIAALGKEKAFEADLVLTLSQGSSFRPHHALLKLPELHHKWMAYIHDPYPMHFYPRPYVWVEPGYYQKWVFMKQISLKAHYTAFPSKLLMEWMGSYFKGYLQKGIVIPHQTNEAAERSILLPSFFDPEKFNLLHAGNLLHARNPSGLITAFELFLRNNSNAKENINLFFIGNSIYHSELLKKKEKEVPQLQVIYKALPFEEVNEMQRKAAVNIILEAKAEISPFLPGKFPHCVAANKPILLLGPYYSESRRLLGSDYNFWAEVDEVEKIAKMMEQLYNNWLEKKPLKLNRPDLEEYLSKNYLKDIFDKVLQP